MEQNTKLLETILAAQVLILEKQIAMEKKAKGISSSGDYIQEAVSLISQKEDQVVARLRQHLRY